MFPPVRYQRWLQRAAWTAVAIAAIGGAWLVCVSLGLPGASNVAHYALPDGPARPETPSLPTVWNRLRSGEAAVPTESMALSGRFRLAGTYFPYGSETDDDRRAVIEDLEEGGEKIVREGDTVGGAEVVRILRDGVVLRQGGEEQTLWLSFSGRDSSHTGTADGRVVAGTDGIMRDPGNRFGAQVGEQKWVFSREALLDYYSELLDSPERLLAVFDSLKPLYDSERNITGYVLDVEGEGEFFEDVGLRPGDVVRQVNSLPMTNRRRAEYFIREFAADRANAFVLDIERRGSPTKLIYTVR